MTKTGIKDSSVLLFVCSLGFFGLFEHTSLFNAFTVRVVDWLRCRSTAGYFSIKMMVCNTELCIISLEIVSDPVRDTRTWMEVSTFLILLLGFLYSLGVFFLIFIHFNL